MSIANKNLKSIFRDKKGTIFLILIPVFFYVLVGFLFGGSFSGETVSWSYSVGFVDLDNTQCGNPAYNLTTISDVMNQTESFSLVVYENESIAKEALSLKHVDMLAVFRDGFEVSLNSTGSAEFDIYFRDSTDTTTRQVLKSTFTGLLYGIINYDPTAAIIIVHEGNVSGELVHPMTTSTPGLLMYGMLMVLSMATIYFTMEHKSGNLKRLETSRMNGADMLGGHLLSNTVVLFMQFALGIVILSFFGFSANPADLVSLVLGVFITVFLTSIFINGLALVSGTLFKTPEASGGGVWVFLIPLMSLSGAFFPIEFVAPGLVEYVRWIPTRITVLLLQDVMVNQISLLSPSIWLNFGILALTGILLFFIGVKMYGKYARST